MFETGGEGTAHGQDVRVVSEMYQTSAEDVAFDALDRAKVDDGSAVDLGKVSGIEGFEKVFEGGTDEVAFVSSDDLGVFFGRLEIEDGLGGDEAGGVGQAGGEPGEVFALCGCKGGDEFLQVDGRGGLTL